MSAAQDALLGPDAMSDDQVRAVSRVAALVRYERYRQHAKWGEQNHPDGTGRPGDATSADLAKLLTDVKAEQGTVTYRDILAEEVAEAFAESDPDRLRTELLQVAAVAVAWVEAIDRRASGEDPS